MKKGVVAAAVTMVAVITSSCNPTKATEESSSNSAQQTSAASSPASQSHAAVARGIQQLKEANVIEAIRSFDDAIRQNPSNVRAYLILAETYLRFNQPQRAIDTLTAAQRMAPPSGDVHYLLSMAYGLTGQRQRALAHAVMAAQIYKEQNDQDNVLRALALVKGLQEALAADRQQANDSGPAAQRTSISADSGAPAAGVASPSDQ